MYLLTNVFFGQCISRKLTDQSRHVQQQVLQFAELESYVNEIHAELGRRFDSSCHGLQTKRKFVALVGFFLQRYSQSVGKWNYRVCRKDGVRITGVCSAAPNSTQAW
jgi:hypothetical protein